jgi:hypothetical protein
VIHETLAGFEKPRIRLFLADEHVREEGSHVDLRREQHSIRLRWRRQNEVNHLLCGQPGLLREAGREEPVVPVVLQGVGEEEVADGPILAPVGPFVASVVEHQTGSRLLQLLGGIDNGVNGYIHGDDGCAQGLSETLQRPATQVVSKHSAVLGDAEQSLLVGRKSIISHSLATRRAVRASLGKVAGRAAG